MSDSKTDDVLQDYLSDLLGVGSESESSTRSAASPAIAAPQSEAVKPMPLAEKDVMAIKREQLQKLLQSARVQVEQVADVDLNEPAAVPVQAPVVPVSQVTSKESPSVGETLEAIEDAVALNVLDEQLEWLDNGRPRWAQNTFEVLLFKVSGLTLAVPLISLGQIQPLTDELTPLFGQADWFMGLQPTASGKVRTVNTAKFVMPERYDPAFEQTAKYVISINGVPWGLAVDNVEQPITLSPEDVKWRGTRTQRPWLAGTVKAHMCALLDIPMVGKLLTDSDKNARLA
ncbi:chemotaxis protein CheW [Gilvimarinus agarilyticus]|uniref:chemotaxis protein CheW n=1 Tax=unclassified Gilvimarinus TaxID=2642066 RepID=UPI001C09DF13|nr:MULTISPECIES: chemotaxis protein CheW [unclassified Gilvimarinus]MBU2887210.1 chemotaxis protein CheW [Gilvimarinus agarilyticus]MDO6571869.1 chemotaxis protein CheW [Gilvimarinus sp. 2_MG-2023]MDO6745938.1 chemotaxis protein CheW [Gilvimarinus sp. 1_MG-2023]